MESIITKLSCRVDTSLDFDRPALMADWDIFTLSQVFSFRYKDAWRILCLGVESRVHAWFS